MPIYAYRCSNCGFQQDVLQKISDPKLTSCPTCGQETYVKQLTAAGFQLKGSGWYATDFRDNAGKAAKKDDAAPDAGKTEGGDAKTGGDAAPATPAPAPAAAPVASPAASPSPAPPPPSKPASD